MKEVGPILVPLLKFFGSFLSCWIYIFHLVDGANPIADLNSEG